MSLRGVSLCAQLKYRGGAFMKTLVVSYRINRGRDASLGMYNKKTEPRDRVGKARFIEEAEDMEDLINMDDPRDFVEITQKEQRRLEARIKQKIIERKYFRKPQEQNLLTWDAKEQVRYLYQEYPDEWTIDRLADSFPINLDGVLKILKSSWQPESLSEVLHHDQRVQKNWLALKSGSGKDGGPIELRYQKLIENGKLALAAGNRLLPAPPKKHYFLTASGRQSLKTISKFLPLDVGINPKGKHQKSSNGPFESLIEGYCKQKETENVAKEQEHTKEIEVLYAKHQDESKELLQEVVQEIMPSLTSGASLGDKKPMQRDLLAGTAISEGGLAVKDGTSRDSVDEDKTLFDKILRMTNEQAEDLLRGENELQEDEKHEDSSDLHKCMERRSLRKQSLRRQREPPEISMNHIQMEGTGKIQEDGKVVGVYSDGEEENKIQEKYARNKEVSQVLSRIRYDIPSGGNYNGVPSELQEKEAYIYTEQTGYQYPLGRMDHEATIKVPKRQKESTQPKMYQKGKAFYDEHGELLYRIP